MTVNDQPMCKVYALFEPCLSIFVAMATVVFAAVARSDLKAVSLLQHAEMQRSDGDVL